ncbi:pyridine nucleotide-disulfide oxidoreductase [Deinococcus radiopugnans]|uniref:Pyridine nucleotide-disulfide oxidoreductase n=1 Tax=Deinococcus radiopugnans TaxID=57497 RepID=A0A0A7KGR5_9DEIO|nr:NAD(P)/FAD-dependent oxidoreductase [Deinococcus radiopugnans]AIZ45300.1 pyridine nucleotide-disulfide oxidoreductase [Deinococcus radiopugnans]
MTQDYDVVIVGAGPAGLTAALTLGGAERRVLLLDGGPPRNARATAAHNVFTRDGCAPTDLKTLGLRDLRPYDITVRHTPAREARVLEDGFAIRHDGGWARARRLLFASGVRDRLPHIPGLRERWGLTVHHCPYCDGWPNRDARLGVLGSHQEGHYLALNVRAWTEDVCLLTDGPDELTDEQREDLRCVGVPLYRRPIMRVSGKETVTVHFQDGQRLELEGLFLNPTQVQNSTLPAALGCELDAKSRVVVNENGMTSVRGIWAAGDMAGAPQYVANAAASGMTAAVSLNTTLIHEDVRARGAAFHKSPDEDPEVGVA